MVPQGRTFDHSLLCHPPVNCTQWHINGGLWTLFVFCFLFLVQGWCFWICSGWKLLIQFSYLKDGFQGLWVSAMATCCYIFFLGSGKLWTNSSESLFPNCSSYTSSYVSCLSFFFPLYLPFHLVIKMSLSCLAVLSLKNFPSILSWIRRLACFSEKSYEMADEAKDGSTAARSIWKPCSG